MIKINLLPTEVGRRATAKAAKVSGPSMAPYVMGLGLLYAGALVAGYTVYQKGALVKAEALDKTKKRDNLKDEVLRREKEFEDNKLRSQEILAKYAVIKALGPESRIFWSEKINMIAQARLNLAVYVTKIQLNEEITEVETQESIKRREQWKATQKAPAKGKTAEAKKAAIQKEPAVIKEPVINQTLKIEAIAYGTDSSQRLRQVTAFYENLKSLEWVRESGKTAKFLDKMVSTDFATLPQKVAQVGGVDVMRFGFEIKATTQKGSVTTPGAPGSTPSTNTPSPEARGAKS